MKKATLRLPAELRLARKRLAREHRSAEASPIREAICERTRAAEAPRPRLPLFASGKPGLAATVDQQLAGFGES